MAACAGLSCSVERHYRTLSFFFDGVPDPNQPPPQDLQSPSSPYGEAKRGPRVKAVSFSEHPPVTEGLCDQCHVQNKQELSNWATAVPTLKASPTELCALCHEPPVGSFTHGPAVNVQCQICHVPHRSLHPHLLRVEQPRTLCESCHNSQTFMTQAEHVAWGDLECVICHDPHSAERLYLLRPEEEIQRRKGAVLGDAQEEPTDEARDQ